MAGTQADARERTRDRLCEDGLEGEGSRGARGKGGAVDVTDVGAPIAFDDTDDATGWLFLGKRLRLRGRLRK